VSHAAVPPVRHCALLRDLAHARRQVRLRLPLETERERERAYWVAPCDRSRQAGDGRREAAGVRGLPGGAREARRAPRCGHRRLIELGRLVLLPRGHVLVRSRCRHGRQWCWSNRRRSSLGLQGGAPRRSQGRRGPHRRRLVVRLLLCLQGLGLVCRRRRRCLIGLALSRPRSRPCVQ